MGMPIPAAYYATIKIIVSQKMKVNGNVPKIKFL